MEKLLNIFGLTTLKQAERNTNAAVNIAVESALGQKPYQGVLNFVQACRKYSFKVVAVGVDEPTARANSRNLAEREFNADMTEQNIFTSQFIPNVKLTSELDLLK